MFCFLTRLPVFRLLAAGQLIAGILLLPILAAPGSAQAESLVERMTKLARAGETRCAEPWTYSRGLGKCICIKAGYSKQWGQCLPMTTDFAAGDAEADSAATSALPSVELPPSTGHPSAPAATGALPEEAVEAAAADPAERMEQVAQAQDCLSSLGLFQGAVDGEADSHLQKAYARFADARGLPASDDILSVRAQTALKGACGQRWASANAQ